MFKDDTTFILGAGASTPYGYPLGKELITHIINNIRQDGCYFSVSQDIYKKYNLSRNYHARDVQYEFFDFEDLIDKVSLAEFSQSDKEYYSDSGFRLLQKNIKYEFIHFNSIDIFHKLKERLIKHPAVSIDAFLRDNPSYGKVA